MAHRGIHLYLVTDRTQTQGRALADVVEAAVAGGVDAVQLREKDLSGRALFELARDLRARCTRYGARLLINDRIDVALAVGADGVHLPVNSFAVVDARRLLGPTALIGASAHTPAQARTAAADGADFIVYGPIFDTPSKRAFGPPLGLEALQRVTRELTIPVLAIGGMNAARAPEVRRHGAHGLAMISAILGATDPRAAAATVRAHFAPHVP